MRSRVIGSLIFSLILGIISGCSTSGKLDSLKDGVKFPSLSSLMRKDSDSSTEMEHRADQLVRIQEYAAAEDLYSKILQREPKNKTIQHKLTDLQWKKRGVATSAPQQEVALRPSQQSSREHQRTFDQSSYRPNHVNSVSQPVTRERVIIKPLDELYDVTSPNPRVAESPIRPLERDFALDSNAGETRIPEWARSDSFETEPAFRRETMSRPAPRNQIRSDFEQQTPAFDHGDPFLHDQPIRREPPSSPSRRPVAQQQNPRPTPSAPTRDEEWTITITPKSQGQQNVQYGSRQLPGVINMKQAGSRTENLDRSQLPEGPAVASVRDFSPPQNSSAIQPDSENLKQPAQSGLAAMQPEPFPFPSEPAVPAERLNALSDAELQERVLTSPQDTIAINEVFQRLGSPDRDTRWRAANTIEVLAFQPESEAIVLTEFVRSISDTDPVLREQSLKILQGMPEQSSQLRDLIRKKLDDENEHVRAAAEAALETATN